MAKELYFVDTLLTVSIKYNKTLEALPLHLYKSIYSYSYLFIVMFKCHEIDIKEIFQHRNMVTNIALGFATCYICHSTLISSCIIHTNL